MKKITKRYLIGLITVVCVLISVIFSACAAKSDYAERPNGGASDSIESNSTNDVAGDTTKGNTVILTEDRLIVYTVELSMSVDDIDATVVKIKKKLAECGGWISTSRDNYEGAMYFTLRVPTEKLDEFLSYIEEGNERNYKTVTGVDITDEYVTATEKKKALEKQKAFLEEELEKEGLALEEKLLIGEKIFELAQTIDSYTSQIEGYKKEADYSTVQLCVYKKGELVEKTYWEELGEIFSGSGASIGVVFGWIIKIIIAILPYLGMLAGVFGLYVLIKFLVCRAKKKPFTLFARARERAAYKKERREELRKDRDKRHTQPTESTQSDTDGEKK